MFTNDFRNKSEDEKRKEDARTAKNRKELALGFTWGLKRSGLVIALLGATKNVFAEESCGNEWIYCDENYIDLDLSDDQRNIAHTTCLANRLAAEEAARLAAQPNKLTQILNIAGAVGSFGVKNSNFILGAAVSTGIVATLVIVYPEPAKKCIKIFNVKTISVSDKELFERAIDGTSDAF